MMSIALERRSNRTEGELLVPGLSRIQVHDSPEIGAARRFPATTLPRPRPPEATPLAKGKAGRGAAPNRGDEDSASCSSSIGRNSDCPGGAAGSEGEDAGEPEVQSTLKGPLDTMDALEDSLPFRRGISKFYQGKSKSFTSLTDVSLSSCAEDLAKQENSHTRKRKSLMSFTGSRDGCHGNPLRGNVGGSTPKRPVNSGRRTSSPAGSASSADSNGAEDCDMPQLRPPLPPNGTTSPPLSGISDPERCYISMRSLSLADLQGATTSSSSISCMEKHKVFN